MSYKSEQNITLGQSCKLVAVEHAGAYSHYGTRKVHRIYSAEWSLPLDFCGHFFVEALIWAESNIDLEEHAGKDVRQEEHPSALSACGSFFGAWVFTHGKPPTAPANPHEKTRRCFSMQFFGRQREFRGMPASMGTASTCLGIHSGVRDLSGTYPCALERIYKVVG